MAKAQAHTVRIIESNGSFPRCYTEPSKAAALRLARDLVKGCVKGEGFVQVYPSDPAGDALCAPGKVHTFRA